jgi:hypothetical protein
MSYVIGVLFILAVTMPGIVVPLVTTTGTARKENR